MRSVPSGPLLDDSEDTKSVDRKSLLAGVGGDGIDFVQELGGLAVIHLGKGAGFDGDLSEGEFGFGERGVKDGEGGPGSRSEYEVVGVGGSFVIGLEKNETYVAVWCIVVSLVGEISVPGQGVVGGVALRNGVGVSAVVVSIAILT